MYIYMHKYMFMCVCMHTGSAKSPHPFPSIGKASGFRKMVKYMFNEFKRGLFW